MRILDPENESDETNDMDRCPHCNALIGDYSEDIDLSYEDERGKVVTAAKCPACGEDIALVAEIDYYIAKLKKREPSNSTL